MNDIDIFDCLEYLYSCEEILKIFKEKMYECFQFVMST